MAEKKDPLFVTAEMRSQSQGKEFDIPFRFGGTLSPEKPEEKPDKGGGGGGGGGPSSPFPGSAGVNLRSQDEIYAGYEAAIAKGQKLLEALGHESFRDLAAAAFASKFSLPQNFEQLISGAGTQPVTNASQLPVYEQSTIGGPARTALQQGITTLPPPGGQKNG